MEQKEKIAKKDEPLLKPDKGTEHTTDPQENMEGPISSLMQKINSTAKENDKKSKEEADRERDSHM